MSTSALHSILTVASSIHDSAGSRGNSTIPRTRFVKAPRSVRAPKFHSWYIELRIFSYMCHRESEREKITLITVLYGQTLSLDKKFAQPSYPCIKEIFHIAHAVKITMHAITINNYYQHGIKDFCP